MCGICGKISLNGKPVDRKNIKEMGDLLAHRGPDGEGFYFNPTKTVGLGHRRLAIIDLKTGGQPMPNEDGTVWIVFNGEIYNFLELKKDLEKKGHHFKTTSDTEVIIHSWEEYGEKCVNKFNGMFAFAIWDEKKQTLFLARDRLGEKPLFYTKTNTSFIFASEIKAILQNQEVKKSLSTEALNMYLSVGYFLSPETIINGIKKLPAASTLTFRMNHFKVKEYWDLNPMVKKDLPEEEWLEQFKNLFENSIKIRLVSDVPLGAFLSGGLDSTAIVSYMKKFSDRIPNTFSIGFKEKTYSELNFARLASEFLKTNHRDLVIRPDIESDLKRIIWTNDEPLGDTSAIPMYFLSMMTRKKVTVALSGDGGDENLAGYETYIADKLFPYLRNLPLRGFISKAISKFLPTSFNKVSRDYKLKQFVRAYDFTPEKAHYFWRTIFSDDDKKKLINSDVYKKIKNHDTFFYFKKYFDKYPDGKFLDRAQYVDIKTWLTDDILVKVDRASMGNSLETRAPFLDYRLVEFLAQVPPSFKLKGFKTKYLLKKAMKGKIPDEIINRKKAGFNAPVPVWLRGDLKKIVLKYLSERNVEKLGLFNYEFIEIMIREYFSGKKDHSLKLWLLLNFMMWYDIFFENIKN